MRRQFSNMLDFIARASESIEGKAKLEEDDQIL